MTTPKYKHFKFEDRYVIQEFLRLNYSFTAIANRLKKDRRAVSKEILKHRFLKVGANKRKLDCTKPDKPPYVCNGCLNKTSCKQNQYIYEASIAQNEYEKTLRQERSRLQVSKETIAAINDIIVPLMTEKHHSVNHVFAAHPELLPMSKSTFYKYIDLGILNVKNIVAESDYNGPYLITEWGPTGWWETRLTDWKAPIEQTSEQKRIVYEERYRNAVASDPRCMGSFVFLWGQKEERTPTWFSMFVEDNVPGLPLNGEKTPMVEAMERVWTKSEPKQTAPVVKRLTINSIEYNPYVGVNETVHAVVEVSDRENDRLTYVWEILKEATITATGGAYEPRPDRVGEVITREENQSDVAVQDEGYYRLYVYVLDNTGYVATANIPFAVQ